MSLSEFVNQKVINLETYKKNGEPVRTPVWFVIHDKILYVVTREKTGKVKRIKNSPKVKIAISSFSGTPKSDWIDANAEFIDHDTQTIISLRNKKYGIKAKLIGLFTYKKGKYVVIAIKSKNQSNENKK